MGFQQIRYLNGFLLFCDSRWTQSNNQTGYDGAMSDWIKLKAEDGHELKAYVARPKGEAIGALVLVQEIFGVNKDVRGVADGYAKDGFVVFAPAIFDRFERDLELMYGPEDMKRAFEIYPKLKPDVTLLDVAAAYGAAKEVGKGIGVIGYCYGGLISWLSATRGENYKMRPSCCVGYYAGWDWVGCERGAELPGDAALWG